MMEMFSMRVRKKSKHKFTETKVQKTVEDISLEIQIKSLDSV